MTNNPTAAGHLRQALPADLREVLQDSPCPFVRTAEVFFVPRGALAGSARATIHAFLQAGAGCRGALIVEAASDGVDHAAARQLAQQLFTTLLQEFAAKAGLPFEKVLRWTAALSREMKEPPILSCGEETFITLALSPHDLTRVRYAPRLCLVVTWARDVVEAERSAPGIMAEAFRRAGGRYDAKDLYLMPGAGPDGETT